MAFTKLVSFVLHDYVHEKTNDLQFLINFHENVLGKKFFNNTRDYQLTTFSYKKNEIYFGEHKCKCYLNFYINMTILQYYHIYYNIIGHCLYMSKKFTVETYYMALLYFSI